MNYRNFFQDFLSLRFIKFCCVGLANIFVDYMVFSLGLWLGFSPYLARSASWCVACLWGYLLNRKWTFGATDKGKKPLFRYAVVNTVSVCLGLLLLYILKKLGCGDTVSFFLSLPFTTAANYLGYKLWVFQSVKGTSHMENGYE